MGLVLMVAEQFDQAIEAFREAARIDPDSPAPLEKEAQALVFTGNLAAAREAVGRALAKDGRHGESWNTLSLIQLLEEEDQESLESKRKAVEFAPEEAAHHAGVAQHLVWMDRFAEAVKHAETAVRLEPHHPTYRHVYAMSLRWTGELDLAGEQLRIALDDIGPRLPERRFAYGLMREFDPVTKDFVWKARLGWLANFSASYGERAHIRMGKGDFTGASRAWQDHLATHPCWPGLLWLGLTRRWAGDLEGASEAFEEELALKANESQGQCFLGFCCLGTGRYDDGRLYLLQYRDYHPWVPGFEPPPDVWERDVDILVRLARRLPGVLEEGAEVDPAERGHLAWLGRETGHYVAATRIAREHFRDNPAAKRARVYMETPRHAAAAAAAGALLAAKGHGKDAGALDEEARTELRAQARDWLEDELELWMELVDSGDEQVGKPAHHFCCWVLQAEGEGSPQIAPVREPSNLRKLPPEEAESWRALWARYRKLYERVKK
jgi:tetratricopeptide (TPR) repeat protein